MNALGIEAEILLRSMSKRLHRKARPFRVTPKKKPRTRRDFHAKFKAFKN